MSSKQRRVAAWWMKHYSDVMARPLRGLITYGGGLNIQEFIRNAEAKGYHATMTVDCVELR